MQTHKRAPIYTFGALSSHPNFFALKFSVITVCLNSAGTIARSLNSVATQTFSSVEHIVIDGGSSDGTLDILGRFSDNIAYLVSEPDSGIYNAMNKGIRASTGHILFFLNSDDYLPDNMVFQDVAECFRKASCPDLVYGNILWDSNGKYHLQRQPSTINRRYLARRTLIHQSIFAKSSLFETTGVFSEDYRIVGDYDWLLRVFLERAPRAIHLNRIVCVMGTAGASWTGQWESERRCVMAKHYHSAEIYMYRTFPLLIRRARNRLTKLRR